MSKRQQYLNFSLLLALSLSFTLSLQAQTGGLDGEVRDFEGKIMPGVTIEIERLDVRMKFEVKTDKKGYYIHAALPGGQQTRYTVRLIRDGQQLYKFDDVIIPIGEIRRLDINLQEERKLQQAQLTDEQKRQLEKMRKAQEDAKKMEEHFYRGRDYLKLEQYAEAIAELEAAAALDPTQSAVFANLGIAYTAAKQDQKAMEAYEKAIALKPEEAGLHNNVGQLYAKHGRAEEARREIETAAQLNPLEASAFYYNLGVTHYNANNLHAAIDPLRKAAELKPNNADAHYWLGVCLYGTAETKIEGAEIKTVLKPGTREAFTKYLELEPNGRWANDAKAMLQVIDATVPASVRVKKN